MSSVRKVFLATPVQSFPVKYCPPCVIALHHFVDYTGQAISQCKLPYGAGEDSKNSPSLFNLIKSNTQDIG